MKKNVYEFISQQTNDPIIEWKTCAISGQEFPIYKSDRDFYDKISPVFDGKRFQIPTPTLCPEERQRRRLLFRNERKLYKRKCDATGKDIVSMYAPSNDVVVYDQPYRRSDAWDPLNYGQVFDFSKTFSEQFKYFITKVPRFALYVTNSINCDYNNALVGSKNCYFTSGSSNEDCIYSRYINDCIQCFDNFMLFKSKECYSCSDCDSCTQCFFSNNCRNSSDLYNCSDCTSCTKCIDCNGLVNKQYHYKNVPISQEQFYTLKLESMQHKSDTIVPSCIQFQCENSIGNYISSCKDSTFVFDCRNSTRIKYCSWFNSAEDCMDNHSWGRNTKWCYENAGVGLNAYHNMGCFWCQESVNMFYCQICFNCLDCLGCIGLRNKSYCIFNKQYTKEEYNQLAPKIIDHMKTTGERGEFLASSISPFGYNETIAQDYFPITKEEALARGYSWQDKNYDPTIPDDIETLKGESIPTDISTVTDDILKKILICEVSGRPFRIIKQELDFYRKYTLSLPRKHPDIRHQERQSERSPRELHLRTCDHCGISMISVYSSEYVGKVYCESCYNKEMYG